MLTSMFFNIHCTCQKLVLQIKYVSYKLDKRHIGYMTLLYSFLVEIVYRGKEWPSSLLSI